MAVVSKWETPKVASIPTLDPVTLKFNIAEHPPRIDADAIKVAIRGVSEGFSRMAEAARLAGQSLAVMAARLEEARLAREILGPDYATADYRALIDFAADDESDLLQLLAIEEMFEVDRA